MTPAVRRLVARTHIFYGSGNKSLAAVLYQVVIVVVVFCRIFMLFYIFLRNPYHVLEMALFCFFPTARLQASAPAANPCS